MENIELDKVNNDKTSPQTISRDQFIELVMYGMERDEEIRKRRREQERAQLEELKRRQEKSEATHKFVVIFLGICTILCTIALVATTLSL